MRRGILVGLIVVAGCQTAPEPIKPQPLPDNQPAAYADLVRRARTLAASANEAFYVDNWTEVESSARGLELTAARMANADSVPVARALAIASQSGQLKESARDLVEAARAKDPKRTNEIMKRINLLVRDLRE
jgi:hypothetical protein